MARQHRCAFFVEPSHLIVLTTVQDILAENAHILGTGNRKARKYMFKAIQNGDFSDLLFDTTQPASMSVLYLPKRPTYFVHFFQSVVRIRVIISLQNSASSGRKIVRRRQRTSRSALWNV